MHQPFETAETMAYDVLLLMDGGRVDPQEVRKLAALLRHLFAHWIARGGPPPPPGRER